MTLPISGYFFFYCYFTVYDVLVASASQRSYVSVIEMVLCLRTLGTFNHGESTQALRF